MRTALFVGSFDPFTIGHDNIARRALKLFDRLVIGVGINPEKKYMFSEERRVGFIRELYSDEPRVKVVTFSDLAVDLAHRENAHFIVKGVRSTRDFEYEREMADLNQQLGDVETVLLMADPRLSSVSSTAVRQLIFFHKDYSEFIPKKK
ncbi:MAG: pantetheine-phosphate adenylyltransferase [Prevotella sp.]|jgi:pantetheine-phosphate adenylyltransferase